MYLKLKINKEHQNNHPKKRTVFWVISAHILVLTVIFLVFCVKGCTTHQKPNAIRVNIVNSAQQPAKPASSPPQKQPLPKEQPVPKKQKKVVKKKFKKTKPKKTWKALDPSQIKKSTSTVIKKNPPKKFNPVKTSDIVGNIRREVKKIRFSNTFSANKSVLNYYDKVSQYLYSRWDQPARTSYNGVPVVQVRISISSNGKILSSSIVSKSGIASMDSSVARLLSTLSTFPPPPEGAMEFDVYMELTN